MVVTSTLLLPLLWFEAACPMCGLFPALRPGQAPSSVLHKGPSGVFGPKILALLSNHTLPWEPSGNTHPGLSCEP